VPIAAAAKRNCLMVISFLVNPTLVHDNALAGFVFQLSVEWNLNISSSEAHPRTVRAANVALPLDHARGLTASTNPNH
jgi:hypothetical protein